MEDLLLIKGCTTGCTTPPNHWQIIKYSLGEKDVASFPQIVESRPVTNSIKFLGRNKIRNAKINVANKTTLAAKEQRDTKEDFKTTETDAASAELTGQIIEELHFLAHEAAVFASVAYTFNLRTHHDEPAKSPRTIISSMSEFFLFPTPAGKALWYHLKNFKSSWLPLLEK